MAEEGRKAGPGDYVTFRLKEGGPEDIRQAVLLPDGSARGELGTYEVGEILGVVQDADLWGSTLAHVLTERWRMRSNQGRG